MTDDPTTEPHAAETVAVDADDGGIRLDRWFRRHYPGVTHALLEKWLRTGQVRIDGGRAKASDRLQAGQGIRVPPHATDAAARPPAAAIPVSPADAAALVARVLYRDPHVVVLDKPAGLSVQGGTKTPKHLDGMLDVLRFGGERPRLVHRLDRDTSGVLILARSAAAASALADAFRKRLVRKLYWAVVAGVPEVAMGRIDLPLAKQRVAGGDRVMPDEEDGLAAITRYRVVERAGRHAAWLALEPLTGRTHQLRVHCAAIGTPILGDPKYRLPEVEAAHGLGEGLGAGLHLHARAIRFPVPGNPAVTVVAPLPAHMRETWRFFGFDEHDALDREPLWQAEEPKATRRPPPSVGRPGAGPGGLRRRKPAPTSPSSRPGRREPGG